MKTDCNVIKELLESYLDNDLSDEKRLDVENHVLKCLSCREELENLSRLEKLLHSVRFPFVSEEALQYYPWKLRLRLFGSFKHRKITRLILTGGLVAAAASILLVIWLYLQLPRETAVQNPQLAQVKDEPNIDAIILTPSATEKIRELLADYANCNDEKKQMEIENEIVNKMGRKALNPLIQIIDKSFYSNIASAENYNQKQAALDFLNKLVSKDRNIGHNDYLINSLVDLLSESDMRTKSINILVELSEPKTINYLIRYVNQPFFESLIYKAFERMGKTAEPYLVKLLYSEDEEIKMNALNVIRHFKVKSAIPTLVSQIQNREFRPTLIDALGEIGSPEVVIPLFELAKDSSLKPLIYEAIKKIGPGCISYLEPYLTGIDNSMKCRAIELIANLQDKKVVPYLIAALPERKVQKAVSESLQEITGENFGIDQQKWRQWWHNQSSPKKKPDKNSGIIEPDETM
jgi:HEAT repeat protein